MIKLKISAFFIFAFILINPVSDLHNSVLFSKTTDGIYDFVQEGIASWYGPGFQGRKTANGERFNTHDLTAAHKTLPFNTILKVTNLENDKFTIVRINDRGPFVRGRIIDLSHAAKTEIGMGGLGRVRIEVYNPEEEKEEEKVDLAPINLFEDVFPYTSKVFIEYGRNSNSSNEDLGLSDEEFNEIFNTFKKIKIKVLTPNAEDANSNIYQQTDEKDTLNYFDVTNRVKFLSGYTFEIGNFAEKSLANELIGRLESLNFDTIFLEEIITKDSTNFKIMVGYYDTRKESKKDKRLLTNMKYKVKLVKIGS